MKWTIRKKLLSSFGIILLFLTVSGTIASTSMGNMAKTANVVQDNWLPSIMQLYDIRELYEDVQQGSSEIVISTDSKRIAELQVEVKAKSDKLVAELKAYESYVNSDEERRLMETLNTELGAFGVKIKEALDAELSGAEQKAEALLSEASALSDKVDAAMDEWIKLNMQGAKSDLETSLQANDAGRTAVIAFGIVAIVVGAALALLISSSMTRSIGRLGAVAAVAAEGDLREKADIKSRDEIGDLAGHFNRMIENLRMLIGQTIGSAQNVAAAAEEISASTEEIAKGSVTQSESAQAVNELFQELTRAVHTVAGNAEEAAELSRRTHQGAVAGGGAVQASMVSMEQLAKQIEVLSNDSNKIGQIIEVIDDIAEQTNLLALNAAIEAARAGEQGKGFAVVADEVRKLAERSGEATKQIGSIIKGMQSSMADSVKAVADTSALSKKTGDVLEDIVKLAGETAQQVSEIAAASEEQAAQTGEVTEKIESIAAVSEQATAAIEETASSSQSLGSLADELQRSITKFRV